MSKEFWAARRPGWVAAGLIIALVAMTVWLFRARSGANTATILALPVGIASLLVAVRGLWPGPPLSRVAQELADRVAQERGRARRQALGMTGDALPAQVPFRSPLPEYEPELVRWRSDGGPEQGTLVEVAEFYRSLDRGRMVVLGEPGAGKTVLASQLVIDLAKGPQEGKMKPGVRPPVPIWLSLTSLDLGPDDWLARASGEEIAAKLDEWMAAATAAVYPVAGLSRPLAERMIRGRWVLPVLDGLDEMDSPSPDAENPERPRAAAVVRALNAGTGRRPVVLVCRRGEYGQLAQSGGAGEEERVLQDATQIVLQPLEVPAICDYLTRRFPGEQRGAIAARWKIILTALKAPVTPGPAEDSLAGVLSSPWLLSLATTAYQEDDSDPGELLKLHADSIGEYLLNQLITVATRRTPRRGGGYYPQREVHSWLGTLVLHLEQTSRDTRLHWSATDLRLDRLWPIAGYKKVQRLSHLASAAILLAAWAVPGLWWVHENGRWYPDNTAGWTALIIAVIGLSFLYLTWAADRDPALQRLDLRFTSPASRKRLAVRLAVGMAIGLAVGLTAAEVIGGLNGGVPGGLAGGLAVGVTIGLAVGLTEGVAGSFSLAAQPTSIMRQNIAYCLAIVLGFGLAVGSGGVLLYLHAYGRTTALPNGAVVGVAVGVAFGLTVALVSGLDAWLRYLIGCWLARRAGMLPRRVGQFLDWAYSANLLRMSGTAVQFRHRELQDWLVRHPGDFPAQTPPEQQVRSPRPVRQ
jgi:hypothetical protein